MEPFASQPPSSRAIRKHARRKNGRANIIRRRRTAVLSIVGLLAVVSVAAQGYPATQGDRYHRERVAQMLPPLMAFDFRLKYEFIQKSGVKATPDDLDRQTQLLGHLPRKFENFVKEAKVAF